MRVKLNLYVSLKPGKRETDYMPASLLRIITVFVPGWLMDGINRGRERRITTPLINSLTISPTDFMGRIGLMPRSDAQSASYATVGD